MMYLYEVFSHADRFRYHAQIISSATCAFILCTALTLLPPFLLTFYTGDFWIQESFYSEQPRLANQTKYILLASRDETNNRFFMSSYATLNQNFQEFVIPGSVVQSSSDIDGDGLIDQYRISFDLILASTTTTPTPSLSSINVWLIFPYELRGRQRITMETLALINIVPPSELTVTSNMNVTVYGQLTFQQKMPIRNSGNDSTYNRSIIPTDNSLSAPTGLDAILDEYFTRKYYTSYQNQYTWLTPRTTSDTNRITISVVLNSGRQSIRFRPGFWQALKWGWIQYISVLLPFLAVFNRLKLFVFSNQLVRTLVPFPIHRHKA